MTADRWPQSTRSRAFGPVRSGLSALAVGWVLAVGPAAADPLLQSEAMPLRLPAIPASGDGIWHGSRDWLASPHQPSQVLEQGAASFYANRFHGRRTASGERYDRNALTAAHNTLPFGTEVVVRSLRTGREVVVRIIDRGPHLKNRIIDLSHAAASALGIRGLGVSEVQLMEKPVTPQP